jgi:hypothetical protein
MYTDDYRKRSYLDVHAFYVSRDFQLHHVALAVHHFGTLSHTADNISVALLEQCTFYNIDIDDTPVTTDHGSNIVASLKNRIRLDCFAHRLNTVISTAWKDVKNAVKEADEYEKATSELCAYAKRTVGLQEQLPCSLKSGGDTRPWLAMYNTAISIDRSYEKLLTIMTTREKIVLVTRVDPDLNKEIVGVMVSVKEVFESLELAAKPTLHLVGPSYYALMRAFAIEITDSVVISYFKRRLREYMDSKFYPSIKAYHWVASFLDPTFRDMEFLPARTAEERSFKAHLISDI